MGFASLIRDNKPLTELIQSKTTYVNEELAKFYKLKGVKGDEMRLVAHTDKRRYGLFGQASVLAVTSSPIGPVRSGAGMDSRFPPRYAPAPRPRCRRVG